MKIATSIDDLITRSELLSMSGLEFLQGMLSGEIAESPLAATLGFHLHSAELGKAVVHGTPELAHGNPMRAVHGGWYGGILDSCMGCAVASTVPKGSFYTTLEYKINITRAIPIGMPVQAIGISQHSGRSTGVAHGEVRGREDDKLYATGSTTCLIMQGEP
ncbi:MAG: PaaI family thioesterase [Marinosulfonomonas sp.]